MSMDDIRLELLCRQQEQRIAELENQIQELKEKNEMLSELCWSLGKNLTGGLSKEAKKLLEEQ